MNSETRDGVLYLSGDITVQTLTDSAYRRFEQQCRLNDTTALDLSGVTRADSACASLLLTALRLKNKAVALRHIPESVRALADLYDIKEWIHP